MDATSEPSDPPVPDIYSEGVREYRARLTPQERALPLRHFIDPGFVNRRLIRTIVGEPGSTIIDEHVDRLSQVADWEREVRIDHIYTEVALLFCEANKVPTLREVAGIGEGRMFCSTEPWGPCPAIYEDPPAPRLMSPWAPHGGTDVSVELHYSRSHIVSDTLRGELWRGDELSVIAHVAGHGSGPLVFHPLVIGNPWLRADDPAVSRQMMFYGRNFYEHFVEDFAEFARVTEVPLPPSPEPMRRISEKAFKRALAEILGDAVSSDWGGETSDYSSAHLNLDGRRVTGAFLLKGPADFSPMAMKHLGKNSDQIYRLAMEPAQVLFVQHCHDVGPAVRATLRAFAVSPSQPRRYCIIDGRDSLRLLQAYGLYDRALEWTNEG